MRLPFLCIALFTATTSFCQVRIKMTGYVKSKKDNFAIPFATIKIQSQEVYTIANEDGYFEFYFESRSGQDSILISALGYNTLHRSLNGFRFREVSLLEPHIIEMKEIVVFSGKPPTAKQIVQRAIEHIRHNYADSFRVEGYFRKYQRIDDHYVSFLDAAVEISDDQYAENKKRKPGEMISVIAARRSKTYNDKGYSNWGDSISNYSNWLARLLRNDDVRSLSGLLNTSNTYDTLFYTTYNGHTCYEIHVLKKPWHYVKPASSYFKGDIRLIIGIDDYRIYKIIDNEHSTNTADKKQFPWGIKINKELGARITGGARTIEFKEVRGKLVLNYIAESFEIEDFKVKTGETIHTNKYSWELFVNKIDELNSCPPRKPGKEDVTLLIRKPYDKSFWESYNMIPFNYEYQKVFEDLSKVVPIEKQF